MVASSTSRASRCKRIGIPIVLTLIVIGVFFIILYFTVLRPSTPVSMIGKWQPNRTIHSFNSCGNSPTISLTFDDGPSVTGTPYLLADLQRLNLKATFFMSPAVNGPPTQQQCQLVKMIMDAGHEIQSHSYDHTDFTLKSGQDVYNNLAANYNWIKSCSGRSYIDLSMFRPPFGSMTPDYASFISKLGYTLASWNVDSLDYNGGNAQQVMQNIQAGMQNVSPGQSVVVLMHDTHYVPGGAQGSLDLIVQYFNSLGYKFQTAPQCYSQCNSNICSAATPVWPGTWDTDAYADVPVTSGGGTGV